MKFTLLITQVEKQYQILAYQNYYDSPLNDIRLLTPGQKEFDSNTLYVGDCPILPNGTVQYANLVITGAKNLKETNRIFYKCNLILFQNRQDMHEIFNFLHQLFLDDISILKDANKLLKSDIIRGYNLKYLTNMCSKMLNNPLLLIDKSFKIMEFAGVNSLSHHTDIELIMQKNGLPYEFITVISKTPEMKNGSNMEPFFVQFQPSGCRVMVHKVIANDWEKVGFVMCFELNAPFSQKHYELLPVFSYIISDCTAKATLKSSLDINENIFYEIISQTCIQNGDLMKKAKDFDLILSDNMRIIVIDFADYKTSSSQLDDIKGFCELYFPESLSIYYNWNIVLLADFEKLKGNKRLLQAEEDCPIEISCVSAHSFANEHHLYIGISDRFSSLSKSRNHYLQALTSIRLSRMFGQPYGCRTYELLKFYDLLEHVQTEGSISQFCHSALLSLLEYDKANSTELYRTLEAFIRNGCNIQRASSELFLHRNTLTYHIKKIEDITGIHLKDEETIFQLTFSFKVMQYLSSKTS